MGLQAFEGHDVIASGVEMPGASGGLHKALSVNDLELAHGDEGVIAIAYKVKKVRFDPVSDTEALERVHVLAITNATPIDAAAVAGALEAQRLRIEEAKGVARLPYEGDDGGEPEETGE